MEKLDFRLTEPRRKKCRAKSGAIIPVPTGHGECSENESDLDIKICLGHLKDSSVHVNDLDEIKHLYVNGFYGKGLFSKGAPETLELYCSDEYAFLKTGSNRKHEQLKTKEITDIKHEPLILSLCEAFYLSHVFGVLVVEAENGVLLSLKKMWKKFKEMDKSFISQYAAYRHFRNKGWVVRSGIKYGVEFVLYKDGPAFYHSTYSVLVCPTTADCSEGEGEAMERASLPSNWTEMSCLIRVTEQVAKELLVCIVVLPESPKENLFDSPTCVDSFKIFEVLMKRWVSKKEREDPDDDAKH